MIFPLSFNGSFKVYKKLMNSNSNDVNSFFITYKKKFLKIE